MAYWFLLLIIRKGKTIFFCFNCIIFICRADTTKVEYLINQPTELNDEGFYICNVTSASGSDIGEIRVDVLGKFKVK